MSAAAGSNNVFITCFHPVNNSHKHVNALPRWPQQGKITSAGGEGCQTLGLHQCQLRGCEFYQPLDMFGLFFFQITLCLFLSVWNVVKFTWRFERRDAFLTSSVNILIEKSSTYRAEKLGSSFKRIDWYIIILQFLSAEGVDFMTNQCLASVNHHVSYISGCG